MSWTLDDIIVAIASPPGPAVRGIVRASGPNVQRLVADSFDCENGANWLAAKRTTRFEGTLRIQGFENTLPIALHLWPDSRSYTGQPTIEIHAIGSPPVLDAIVQSLIAAGGRAAKPGEFTLRSFLAGKIDLVQAEAVLGVIDADSAPRLQQALSQLAGGVSDRIRQLRESLLLDLADLEAGLDFVDEDIEFVERSAMANRLEQGLDWIRQLRLHTADRGQSTGRQQVVLAGLPNAGKSTLFNALAGQDAAVVSPTAGTTRDWLTATVTIGSLQFDLIDTAGREQAETAIGRAAQRVAIERTRHADLILWCTAADTQTSADDNLNHQLEAARDKTLRILTKSDVALSQASAHDLSVSAATGEGLENLRRTIATRLSQSETGTELLSSTLARCQGSLAAAEESLTTAHHLAITAQGDELISFELRRGLEALGEIAGVIYTDDLLDRIFSRFCIGK
jgi:tRNA modification GTPase